VSKRHYIPQPTSPRPPRPLGVWLLTLADGFSAGVVSIVKAIFGSLLMQSFSIEAGITLVVATGVMVSAFYTWRGNDRARIALLGFITLNYGLLIFQSVLQLFSGSLNVEGLGSAGDYTPQITVIILTSVLWIVLNIAYFLSPLALPFYRFRVVDPD